LKQHEPWFHEECPKLLDQKKQAKLLWLQNPSQTDGDDLNNIGHETIRTSRNKKKKKKKKKYLK
jgi:hypothetical protein